MYCILYKVGIGAFLRAHFYCNEKEVGESGGTSEGVIRV